MWNLSNETTLVLSALCYWYRVLSHRQDIKMYETWQWARRGPCGLISQVRIPLITVKRRAEKNKHRSCVALWAEAKGGDAAIQHFINGFLHQSNDCSELKILSKIGNPMRQLIPCTEQSGVWFLLSRSVWTCSNIWTLGIQSGFWVCWREWQQPHWPQPVNTQRSSDFPVWLMHSPSSNKIPSNGEFKAQQQTWNP